MKGARVMGGIVGVARRTASSVPAISVPAATRIILGTPVSLWSLAIAASGSESWSHHGAKYRIPVPGSSKTPQGDPSIRKAASIVDDIIAVLALDRS